MHRRHAMQAALLLGLLPALSACTAPVKPLRLGSIVFTGYEPVFLARELGWLDESQVRLIELFSNTDGLRALAAGQLEAAQLTLDEFITARADGLNLRIVAVLDESSGADAVIARPGLRDPQQLKGLRIAVEEGAAGAVMLAEYLRHRGLTPQDVQTVPMTLDRSLQAYRSGLADLFISAEPWVSQLEAEGGQRVFDSRALPGRIVDVMVARADALAVHGQAIEHLVHSHFRAVQFLKNQPDVAVRLMAPRLQMQPPQVLAALRGLVQPDAVGSRQMLQDGSPFMAGLLELQKRMLDDRLIQRLANSQPLFDTRFHPQ
jgi:NitT/TauT family transport system substrate-binding protein